MQKNLLYSGLSLLVTWLLSLVLIACGDFTTTSAPVRGVPTVSDTNLTLSTAVLPASPLPTSIQKVGQGGVDLGLTVRAATVNAGSAPVKFVKTLITGLQPVWISLDSHNDLDIIDAPANIVLKYDLTGKRLASFGNKGKGDGEFDCTAPDSPVLDGCSLTVDKQGNIYVADTLNQRVQKFDKDGKFLLKWGSEGTANG